MAQHAITLSTEELVFVVGALIETHKRYVEAHHATVAMELPSPYEASIAYMHDAYQVMNPQLPVPRTEILERNP